MSTASASPARTAFSRDVFFLGFLNALGPFTIDLYLPTFSEIARDLNVSFQKVSLSVASYFVGFAVGQLTYGPLLDRFGRKRPMLAGLALYLLSSLGCMSARSIEALYFFRFLSALGGAAASVGTMTLVRDLFPNEQRARVFAVLMLVLSVSPLLAPSIGAWLSQHVGWRSLFGILAGVSFIDLLIVRYLLPSAYTPSPGHRLNARAIAAHFKAVLQNPSFRTHAFAGGLSFSGLFVYVASSASIFLDGFGVSKRAYGLIFALLASGMIGGGQLNHWLLKRFRSERIFRAAVYCEAAIASLFALSALAGGLGLYPSIAGLFLVLFCAGIANPHAASLALAPFTASAGSASSLMGFIQIGTGAVVAAGVGLSEAKGVLPTALAMSISSLLATAVLATAALKVRR